MKRATERSSWGHTAVGMLLGRPGWFRVKTAPPIAAGTPDILACYEGWFIGIEMKSLGKKETKLQRHRMSEIEKAGGCAFLADSIDSFRRLIGVIEEGSSAFEPWQGWRDRT